jgi:hypothetical protein
MDPNTKILASARLRALIQVAKLQDHKGLGDAAGGADKSAVGNWLNVLSLIPVDHASALCVNCGITLDWLYRGVPDGIEPHKLAMLEHFMDQDFIAKKRAEFGVKTGGKRGLVRPR